MANELTARKIDLDFATASLEITNYDELKAEVERYAERYKGLIFTRDEKAGASQARSELKALYDAIENERKNVKSVYNKPLQEFENQIKALTDLINEPLNDIRDGLKVIDEAEKAEREEALDSLLTAKLEGSGLLPGDIEKKPQWLNKGNWTAKLKPTAKLEAEIGVAIELVIKENKRQEAEIKILTEFCKAQGVEPAGWISQLEYKSAMEVIDLINLERERKERLQKEQEERQKQHEAFIQQKAQEAKEIAQFAQSEPVVSEPETFTSTIKVTGTAEQLNNLNNYLVTSGISVEEVPQVTEDITLDDLPW